MKKRCVSLGNCAYIITCSGDSISNNRCRRREIKRNNKKNFAFTLVELMIVIGILSLLLLLVVPRLTQNNERARIRVFEANYRAIASDLVAAHSSGNAKEAELRSVRKKAENYKDRPEGSTYIISDDGLTYSAKLGSYELVFDLFSGLTTSLGAPEGASYPSP